MLGLLWIVLILTLPISAYSATIWVDPSGNNGNNCTSEATACQTIQGGVDKSSSGDLILVKPGVYYEQVTISNRNNIWLLSFPRNSVTISRVAVQAARQATQTWTSDGDNRWRISHTGFPIMLGYRDASGTDWFLPHLKCSDLNDHLANLQNGTGSILEYGFCTENNLLKARFPNNDNPNGQIVKINPNKFQNNGIVVQNSDDVIIDGFIIESASLRAVAADTNSDRLLVRNVECEYAFHCVRIGPNGVVEWTRYRFPGYENYLEATVDLPQGGSTEQAFVTYALAKEYDPLNTGDHTFVSIEGTILEGHSHTTGEIRNSVVDGVFDGLKFSGLSNTTAWNMVFTECVDNCIELESDNLPGGTNNVVRHSYVTGKGHEHFSIQASSLITATIHHNVIEHDSDDVQDNINRVIKNATTNSSSQVNFYNNVIRVLFKGFFDTAALIDPLFEFRNNIITANSNGANGFGNPTVSNNILIRASNNSAITANGGIHNTSTASLNWASATDYGITSGSIAENSCAAISGIETGDDCGPFQVGESSGQVGVAWPRNANLQHDNSIPAGWSGDTPPNPVCVSP
jgi:hypothetical protein